MLLTLFSTGPDERWFNEFKPRNLLPALGWFWLGCFVRNVGFAGAAFLAGHVTRWLWL